MRTTVSAASMPSTPNAFTTERADQWVPRSVPGRRGWRRVQPELDGSGPQQVPQWQHRAVRPRRHALLRPGDGGGQCNSARPGVPQDIKSPYGKILRLDPNAEPPYAAVGNPFASNGDARVLHWGFRNPDRFGFDWATGDLFIGDVGQWDYEEISWVGHGHAAHRHPSRRPGGRGGADRLDRIDDARARLPRPGSMSDAR
jgi:hypothetical protein